MTGGGGQDVKYSSTQYIVPWSNVWRIPALCYDLNLGMIFYFNQDFSGSGVVSDATPHTHVLDHSLAWKILVSIKNHPLTLVHNRGQVYAIPCFTGKYTGWKCTITSFMGYSVPLNRKSTVRTIPVFFIIFDEINHTKGILWENANILKLIRFKNKTKIWNLIIYF